MPCPSNHWNGGDDRCADCGADLNPAAIAAPFTANGMTYGDGPGGRRVCRGAMQGRYSTPPGFMDPRAAMPALHLAPVPLDQGGYDPGGAYWGLGDPLWCVWSDDGEWVNYRRAADLEAVKRAVEADEGHSLNWAPAAPLS